MLPDPHTLAGQLAQAHVWLSLDVLGAVASCPERGVPLAVAGGVDTDTFLGEDDTTAMWLAMRIAAQERMDRLKAARLVCHALKAAGCWHPDGAISASGPFWNLESVGLLFDSYPGPSTVPLMAAELVELTTHWRRVWRLSRGLNQAIAHAAARLHPKHAQGGSLDRAFIALQPRDAGWRVA
jgi:hypothetical protein